MILLVWLSFRGPSLRRTTYIKYYWNSSISVGSDWFHFWTVRIFLWNTTQFEVYSLLHNWRLKRVARPMPALDLYKTKCVIGVVINPWRDQQFHHCIQFIGKYLCSTRLVEIPRRGVSSSIDRNIHFQVVSTAYLFLWA